jgi:hypothetical protein
MNLQLTQHQHLQQLLGKADLFVLLDTMELNGIEVGRNLKLSTLS